MSRLTPRQSELLGLIRYVGELSLYGPTEFRAAKGLERKGLIHIDHHDKATLATPTPTPADAVEGDTK